MKRYALVLFLLAAACSLVMASGSQAGSSQAGQGLVSGGVYNGPDKDIVTPKGQFPIVKQPVSLTIGMVQNVRITDYPTNEFTKLLEEKSGVKLEFNLLASADARAKVSLMFASNDLPDVLSVGGNIEDMAILEYGMDGLLVPMNPLIEVFGDEIYKMWDTATDKSLRGVMTSADGNIYSLPKYSEQYMNYYSSRCYLYGPWMDTLNLKPAKTIAEFTDILRAFKTKDPNGNGIADEIPLISHNADTRAAMTGFFFNAFIYYDNNELMEVKDGKLSPIFITEEYRQAIVWLNSLVKEGLLDPVSFTQDEPSLRAIMNRDPMVVGSFANANRTGVLDTNGERSRAFIGQPPLEGPNGVRWSVPGLISAIPSWQITSVCEYPAVAYRLGDLMLSYDITFAGRFGFEGRDWVKVTEPGKFGLDGSPAAFEQKQDVWAMTTQNIHWQWPQPGFMPFGTLEGMLWNGDPLEYNYNQVQMGMPMRGLQPKEYMPIQRVMNAEEAEIYAQLRPTIHNWINENTSRFIVGDRPLSEWNAYVAEFEKMQLPKLVATLQGMYTRMNSGN